MKTGLKEIVTSQISVNSTYNEDVFCFIVSKYYEQWGRFTDEDIQFIVSKGYCEDDFTYDF